MIKKIQYNSPVVLTFSLASLVVLLLGIVTKGASTRLLFGVYRSSIFDPLMYIRMFTYVLGHSGWEHYMGNILLMLVIGPPLEERYGSKKLLICIVITAFVGGLVQCIFFPGVMLIGASGIVFMMMILSSLSGMRDGGIPLTLIIVVAFYLGGEIITAVTVKDNISQMTHVIGGLCGASMGFAIRNGKGSPG